MSVCTLNAIESEVHVLMHYNQYAILRQPLLDRAYTVNPNVINLNDTDKLCFVLTDSNMCRISAKTVLIFLILECFIYVNNVFVIFIYL